MLLTFNRHVAATPFTACAYRAPTSTTLYVGVYAVFASSIGRRPTSCQFSITNVAGPAGTRYSVSTFDFHVGMPTKCLPSASADKVLVIFGSSTVNPPYVVT